MNKTFLKRIQELFPPDPIIPVDLMHIDFIPHEKMDDLDKDEQLRHDAVSYAAYNYSGFYHESNHRPISKIISKLTTP